MIGHVFLLGLRHDRDVRVRCVTLPEIVEVVIADAGG